MQLEILCNLKSYVIRKELACDSNTVITPIFGRYILTQYKKDYDSDLLQPTQNKFKQLLNLTTNLITFY